MLPGLAQSPDMNSITNALATLKWKMPQESTYCTSRDDLFNILSEIWDSIPSAYFETLIASMNTRVFKLHKAKGLSTKYYNSQ